MKTQSHTIFSMITAATLLAACGSHTETPTSKLTDYVNPKIGSGGHGHVFVGANVPYGMIQLGPTSLPQIWDWTSGYHDSDSTVIGFSHTHLSGTGAGDLFDVTLMPVIGEVTYARGEESDPTSGLWSYADRSKEIVKPGYYSVPLLRNGVLAELTATERTGLHRYSFPASDSVAIVIDLKNGGCWDRPTETSMNLEGDCTITGIRRSTGWAEDQKLYFVAEFSEPIQNFSLHGEEDMYGRIDFAPSDRERQVIVKVGISPTSIEMAKKNLQEESANLSFDEVVALADYKWEEELSRIRIESDDRDELEKFYTSMYHLMFHPSLYNDINETPQYTILSLWDTYRAQMPLLSIIDPRRTGEIVNSMLDIYDTQGRLPVWHLWGNETDMMIGNPGIIIVGDGVVKHTPGIDYERALNAMIATANDTARGGGMRAQYGYIPIDRMNEAVSWDMEYAIADAAIANAAKTMNRQDIADEYTRRSMSYKNYFDPSTGFMRGKDSKGEWRTPFNPSYSQIGCDYCEGNAWQYTWLVPHDVEGLRDLFGGKDAMISKLDSLFIVSSELDGDKITPDLTGFIGQYIHGNEPSHHIAYIYSMLGEREKTADLVTRVMDELYSAQPDGLSGNEDCGQMSAWYIFSALGFYPVEPAGARYWIGTPRYSEATIMLPENKAFTVRKGNENSSTITLNGKPLDRNYITHDEIMAGGELIIN